MIRTRVGYAGGTLADPTYHHLGDHTEVVQVAFDPSRISYPDLLDVFFASHDPFWPSLSVQYRSVILTGDDEQARLALEARTALGEASGRTPMTSIEPLGTFTSAEGYHQKYELQKHDRLTDELSIMFPVFDDLVDSTLAARLNGYAGGYGTREELEAEIASFGLSASAMEYLRTLVGGSEPGCPAPGTGEPPDVIRPPIPGLPFP